MPRGRSALLADPDQELRHLTWCPASSIPLVFSAAEIDIVLDEAGESSTDGAAEAEDQVSFALNDPLSAVTRPGDLWCLGRHRLVCGDARDRAVFDLLMGDERANLIFTDPPYNAPIDGHVTGLGRIRHREFAMGVCEMSAEAFKGFLQQTLGHAAARARSGAIAFVCMDWRHMGELLKAGHAVFSELKNLCVGTTHRYMGREVHGVRPLRTKAFSVSISKPWAIMTDSVLPSGEPALMRSGRRSWRRKGQNNDKPECERDNISDAGTRELGLYLYDARYENKPR
jgi:hypothetical protein